MNTQTKKIKVGFAALGDHALQSHLAHMVTFKDVEIIGAFDPNLAGFSRAKELYGAQLKSFNTYEDLLNHSDCVIICSPDRFHTDQLSQAAQRGVHALCEKPLCSDENTFKQLEGIFAQTNTVITSCHPRRYDPPYVWLKEHIEELIQAYGNPISIDLDFTYHHPSAEKRHLHGDSLLQDHANHEIDYVNYLFGATGLTATKMVDEFDRHELAGVRADKIVFRFQGTRRLEAGTYAESIKMRFDRGELYINTYVPKLSYLYEHENQKRIPIQHDKTNYDTRFCAINRNFIDTIKTGKGNYLTPDEMLLNSRMSVAFQNANTFSYNPLAKERS